MGRREKGQVLPPDIWTMQEILSPAELVAEGVQQCHCVASYHLLVRRRSCSIWSLRRNGHRRLTVEVVNKRKMISQVSGFANRDPRHQEIKILSLWAAKNELHHRYLEKAC